MMLRSQIIYAALSLVTRRNIMSQASTIWRRLECSHAEMEAFQLARCRELLIHANRKIPYYGKLFKSARFNPEDFASCSELSKIPVLTRSNLTKSFNELSDPSVPASAVVPMSTGGTTGQPVTVLHDKSMHLEKMLVAHRTYSVAGWHLGNPVCVITGRPIDFSARALCTEKVKNLLFNISIRSGLDLTSRKVARIVSELAAGKWNTVLAYASVFDILSDYVCEHKIKLHVARIIPCGELVTDTQKERWRTNLGAEVFEVYGSREMSVLAIETPDHRQLVVNGDLYYVEITDESGKTLPDGEPGLITVTNLLDHTMPLIRYQLGDVGILMKPDPNDPFPFRRLKVTHGRSVDIIKTPEGKLLPGEYFPHLFKEVSREVERFQVVQTEINKLVVKVVRKPDYSPQTEVYLTGKIQAQVSPKILVAFEYVDAIETSGSGKYRPTISKIRNTIGAA